MDLKTQLIIEWVHNENIRLEEENKRLRAALFCEKCGGTGRGKPVEGYRETLIADTITTYTWPPCPVCGPIREELRKEGE